MTGSPVIAAERLGKHYRLAAARSTSLREAMARAGARLLRGQDGSDGTFWALRDASFTVAQGEVIGLVGNNGSGKSTLLKLLSRITPPSEGTARLRGRLSSLLEVGTGFHPDLSGRENVFMNGVLLGMSQHEVRRHFDEIVEFAGIQQFIDLPVKRYSSGMYLRLAFGVAAHLVADILLIDEVLAVGDVSFQRKCLARMGEVANEGRTILFVSHNLTAVQALCPRSIWISQGRLLEDGDTRSVLSAYLKSAGASGLGGEQVWAPGQGPGAEQVKLRRATARSAYGSASDPVDVRTPVAVEFELQSDGPSPATTVAFQLTNEEGALVFDAGPREGPVDWSPGLHRFRALIPADLLNDGSYRITFQLYQAGELALHLPNLLALEVLDTSDDRHGWYGKWEGVIRPRLHWDHEVGGAS
jgi:lipopolysaccharide transport system ATP-binding protein